MFINMLGYPTHFGQMECLKLISSASFPEKRIGYLGMMLLLDENQEVLMLVTNSLGEDLKQSNQYVVGLALCALANISSSEIARALNKEVEKLMRNSNPYIRKKAALCAIRVIRKCPELAEEFLERATTLLNERNHGVLISAVALLIEACEALPECTDSLRKLVPSLVRHLKNLVLSGYAPEHDVSGITDPFLQVKIIKLLRYLGKGDSEASDAMNDILAQVATNTETSKNAGNAILYECVQTIMAIESESGLRVLAINILGRFLLNRDNNIRYVALNTLQTVLNSDLQAVQRHRKTVVECLKDNDISIRRRALALTFGLVNESNVRVLARELLNFLMTAEGDMKAECVAKICQVVDKHSPNRRWRVDNTIRVITLAGEDVSEDLMANLIQLIASTEELQGYAVQRLWLAAKEESDNQALLQALLWCLGEFAQLLVQGLGGSDEEAAIQVSEEEIVDFVETVMTSSSTEPLTKQYGVTACAKLCLRISEGESSRLQPVMDSLKSHMNVEIQQRACEFRQLMGNAGVRSEVFASVPAATLTEDGEEGDEDGEVTESRVSGLQAPSAGGAPAGVSLGGAGGGDDVDDLLGDLMNMGGPSSTGPGTAAPAAGGGDDLEDLLGGMLGPAPTSAPAPSGPSGGDMGGLMDLMGGGPTPGGMAQPAAQPMMGGGAPPMMGGAPAPAPNTCTAYQKHGLTILFTCLRSPENPAQIQIKAAFTNSTQAPLTKFVFQAAVPKDMKLQLLPASGNTVPAGNAAPVTQVVNILNPQGKPLKVMMKIQFEANGQMVQDQAVASSFPQGF
jgi:AP-1 complex subunit gamma-1